MSPEELFGMNATQSAFFRRAHEIIAAYEQGADAFAVFMTAMVNDLIQTDRQRVLNCLAAACSTIKPLDNASLEVFRRLVYGEPIVGEGEPLVVSPGGSEKVDGSENGGGT